MITQDIHFYSLISFLLMVFVGWKYGHKKIGDIVQSKVKSVEKAISDAENKKMKFDTELTEELKNLELINHEILEKTDETEVEIKKIRNEATIHIEVLRQQNEADIKVEISKIYEAAYLELRNRMIQEIISDTEKKATSAKNKKIILDSSFENSIKMIKSLPKIS